MWGSVGMTYNIDMVKERIPDADFETLDLIMKPEYASLLADCGISLLDSPNDIGYMILSYLGIDPNTAGPAEWAKLVEPHQQKLVEEIGGQSAELWAAIQKGKQEYAAKGGK